MHQWKALKAYIYMHQDLKVCIIKLESLIKFQIGLKAFKAFKNRTKWNPTEKITMRRKRIKIFYRPWIGIRIEPEKCPMLEQPECPMLEHLCFIFEPPDHVFKNYSTKQSPFLTYFRKNVKFTIFSANVNPIETVDWKMDSSRWELTSESIGTCCNIMHIFHHAPYFAKKTKWPSFFNLLLNKKRVREKFLECCRNPYFKYKRYDLRLSYALGINPIGVMVWKICFPSFSGEVTYTSIVFKAYCTWWRFKLYDS